MPPEALGLTLGLCQEKQRPDSSSVSLKPQQIGRLLFALLFLTHPDPLRRGPPEECPLVGELSVKDLLYSPAPSPPAHHPHAPRHLPVLLPWTVPGTHRAPRSVARADWAQRGISGKGK